MNRKLLPAVIGAALIGGMTAAQADVTVFGHLDTSVINHDTDAGYVNLGRMPGSWTSNVQGWDDDDTNFRCTTCSLGFKGSEDLGNGLKAIFKLDFQFDMFNRNSSGSITDRDQWLGLAGDFGQVRFGTISTSYKSHGAMIDPLYRTAAQGRDQGMQSFLHSNAGEEGEGRADNTVRYDSPDWNGLMLTAHYTLDSDESTSCFNQGPNAVPPNSRSCEDDDPYGAGVQYTNGGLLVFADYLTNDSSSTLLPLPGTGNTQGDLSAWKVGGKYAFGNFAVYGQYEQIDDDFGSGVELDADWWTVAGSYTMGNNMLYVSYGDMSADDVISGAAAAAAGVVGNTDFDQTAITVAATHSLSKRTLIYAAWVQTEQDYSNAMNTFLTNNFVDVGENVNDPENTLFAIGMKHKF